MSSAPDPEPTFDPASWSTAARTVFLAAGALDVSSTRPTAISVEWPVVHPRSSAIPLEIQQQDGGTLLVVGLFSWRLSVTPANKTLVDLIGRHLCRQSRADKGFIDINWQYVEEDQRSASFSLDDYVYADGADWLELLLTSAKRHAQIFLALDPLVRAAAAGEPDEFAADDDEFADDDEEDVPPFNEAEARVVIRDLADRLAGRERSPEVTRLRAAFPAITRERFDGDSVRAIQLEGRPETIVATLHALDTPLLADVDEVSLAVDADTVIRLLEVGPLPRRLHTAILTDLDSMSPSVVCAALSPFQDCTQLFVQLEDKGQSRTDMPSPPLVFPHLEVLELDSAAVEFIEDELLDRLFASPLPKLRRFALNSRHRHSGGVGLDRLLARLPAHVTELGLWQPPFAWPALREALLGSSVLDRLTAVGVIDDIDEMSDPRLAGKVLFAPSLDIDAVGPVAHDLGELGRHKDIVDQLGPLRWRTDDVVLHERYASALAALDPDRGVDAWRALLALDPTCQVALHNLANLLMALHRTEEAFPAVVAALVGAPEEPWMLRCLAVIWQERGNAVEADTYAQRFIDAAAAAVVDAEADVDGATRYVLACAQMWAGERDAAFATLEEAVAAGLTGVKPSFDVEWDPVRAEPRWQRLLDQGA